MYSLSFLPLLGNSQDLYWGQILSSMANTDDFNVTLEIRTHKGVTPRKNTTEPLNKEKSHPAHGGEDKAVMA